MDLHQDERAECAGQYGHWRAPYDVWRAGRYGPPGHEVCAGLPAPKLPVPEPRPPERWGQYVFCGGVKNPSIVPMSDDELSRNFAAVAELMVSADDAAIADSCARAMLSTVEGKMHPLDLRIFLGTGLLRCEDAYKKPRRITVFRAEMAGTCRTKHGPVSIAPGDYVLFDAEQLDSWPIKPELFAANYAPWPPRVELSGPVRRVEASLRIQCDSPLAEKLDAAFRSGRHIDVAGNAFRVVGVSIDGSGDGVTLEIDLVKETRE